MTDWLRPTQAANLMRNAQFSHPIAADRLEAICSGACEPIAFDYQRAFGVDAVHA